MINGRSTIRFSELVVVMTASHDLRIAVVTGSSSGIGYETSLLLARNQITTYATMRNMSKSNGSREIASKEKIPLNVAQLDVNNDPSVESAIDFIIKENAKIDLLVNNAG